MSKVAPPPVVLRSARRRIAMLSTYQPNRCALATFTAALGAELRRVGHRVEVVRVDDGDDAGKLDHPVVARLGHGDPASLQHAAAVLSRGDVAIIQHGFDIYGRDSGELLDVLAMLDAPAIVVLHSVPSRPTARQRAELEGVCDGADRIVVMAEVARKRLTRSYRVDRAKVVTIPHGATVALDDPDGLPPGDARRPQLVTWGLLEPGAGIEHVIDALALLQAAKRPVRYTVAGVTHPKAFAAHGEHYRRELIQRSWAQGVARSVTFDDTSRSVSELSSFVSSAAVAVLPYDSRDQVTSAMLVEALAAGLPVIATGFSVAVELLRSGAGIVVAHDDPGALAAAIQSLLIDRGRLEAMAAEARRLAPTFGWDVVADQYVRLVNELSHGTTEVAV